jgi:hypothetical protein
LPRISTSGKSSSPTRSTPYLSKASKIRSWVLINWALLVSNSKSKKGMWLKPNTRTGRVRSFALGRIRSADPVTPLSSQNDSRKIPERLAFTLDNPIRRVLDPPERLIGKLSINADDPVVDFGCGPGYFLIPLAHLL